MSDEQQELNVNDTVSGSVFAQVAAVNASGGIVTIDFIYVHPRQSRTQAEAGSLQGQVVSRVTMPFGDAKSFSDALAGILVQHGKKYTED